MDLPTKCPEQRQNFAFGDSQAPPLKHRLSSHNLFSRVVSFSRPLLI